MNVIFLNFDTHVDCEVLENHKYYIVKLIIELYIKINLYHIGKEYTLEQHKQYVRETLSKTTHFLGQ